jgi:Calx-beta domain/RTX calcium-binding nonapeptide repeat (4 copies)
MKQVGRRMLMVSTVLTGLALLLSTSAPAATIVGTAKNDFIRGTAKADTLIGRAGSDKLYGLGGNDTLVGGSGNDTLVGGAGTDKLRCGPGHDVAIADTKDKVSADCETVRGPLPSISIGDASVAEGDSGTTPLAFELTLSRSVTWKVSVMYETADETAKAGSDYTAAQGTVTFAPGETAKTVEVEVNGDTVAEPDETLTISLSRATNATIADGSAMGTITNDDHEWHRLNSDHSHPPEHELFQCVEGSTWTCRYTKVPEPTLNFQWTNQQGTFIGSPTQAGQWTCPSWFPSTICANASRVAQGIRSFEPVSTAIIRDDLIVTKTGNHEQMYEYWVGQHVCPWYQTFDEALAANPFPLPFNGTNWPALDCVFAP